MLAYARARLSLMALVTVAGFVTMIGCGAAAHRSAPGSQPATSAACVGSADSAACLQLLDQIVHVRSIPLTTRIPTQVTSSCLGAARMTRIRVVCPPLVPAGGAINDPELYGPQIVDRESYSVSINNGQNPGHIHWEFGAIKGAATKLWVFDRTNWAASGSPPPARRIAVHRYLGRLVTLYRFPDNDGQLEGHDAAFATEDGTSYFVSIHGHNDDDADTAMLLAILLARER
jgi:hypothetical protein